MQLSRVQDISYPFPSLTWLSSCSSSAASPFLFLSVHWLLHSKSKELNAHICCYSKINIWLCLAVLQIHTKLKWNKYLSLIYMCVCQNMYVVRQHLTTTNDWNSTLWALHLRHANSSCNSSSSNWITCSITQIKGAVIGFSPSITRTWQSYWAGVTVYETVEHV